MLTDRVNRSVIMLAGGAAMVWVGLIDWPHVFTSYIDWPTLTLLFSMFIVLKIVERTGVFQYVAIKLIQSTKGHPGRLYAVMATIVAGGSALLDNVTTVIVFVPVLLSVTRHLKVPATPYLISTMISANIGGMATLIGSPPNVMIGQEVEAITFNDFLFHLAPLSILLLLIIHPLLYLIFRKRLQVPEERKVELVLLDAQSYVLKTPALTQSLTILILILTGFVTQPYHGTDVTSIAAAGALLMLLIVAREHAPDDIFRSIDWGTLLFFIGLFMMVGGLNASGWIDQMASLFFDLADGDSAESVFLLLFISGAVAGFVDNIPFTAAMLPVVEELGSMGVSNVKTLWWALAIGSSLGANATLIGSSANMIVTGLALRQHVRLSFLQFALVGIPVVLLTLLIASLYMYIRYIAPHS